MGEALRAAQAPHLALWRRLSESVGQVDPGAGYVGGEAAQDDAKTYRALIERVEATRTPAFWPATPGKRPLSAVERAGLVRLAGTIPGACGEAKMHAVIEALRHAPAGDIVEIGSWWGRSAALFALLARRWEIGQVLCVDPWAADVDGGGDEALRIFEINLAPMSGGRLNYIRGFSADAAERYAPGLKLKTEAFGATTYQGLISVLHIDGDHAEGQVERDAAMWAPHVVPGGWIIFNAYDWALGDGPRRAADAFAEAQQARIAATFEAGGAFFIQLKSAPRM
jgi:hypothetical protein